MALAPHDLGGNAFRSRGRGGRRPFHQRPWPADKVERWAIDRLSANTSPLLRGRAPAQQGVGLDDAGAGGEDGGLIAGHARVLAARQLGIAEIPVMVAAGWSEAQKRA